MQRGQRAPGPFARRRGGHRLLEEDFAARGRSYDVVFDAVGKYRASHARRALAPGGRLVSVKGSPRLEADDLERLRELCADGTLTPVIDRTYALQQAAEAHRYVEQGHKKGNLVLIVSQDGQPTDGP